MTERQRDALQAILDWCESYPAGVFPEVDDATIAAARKALGDPLITRLHGSWARHLLSGIGAIAREGLRE